MKIGAIGIRTKIIVGDAATWHLVKKYLDNVVIKGGITPEEKAKLAGIEENANNYTHPETHPASILDVVDVVNGDAKKFMSERGEMVAVAHESLTDKNGEEEFQHVDTTTVKTTLDEADKVALWDSMTGKVVLSTALNDIETILASI